MKKFILGFRILNNLYTKSDAQGDKTYFLFFAIMYGTKVTAINICLPINNVSTKTLVVKYISYLK